MITPKAAGPQSQKLFSPMNFDKVENRDFAFTSINRDGSFNRDGGLKED